MKSKRLGFTLIELMIVVAIIGILASLSVPSYQDRIIRKTQVEEALRLSEIAKDAVSDYYAKRGTLPKNNATAGLPESNKIIGNYVSAVEIDNGAINIILGNRVNRNVAGKVLTIRPAIVDGTPIVPIAWVCGNATPPNGMTVVGENATTLASYHLPCDCRL
jgi:type IV pilus assembly protein PilA